MKDGPAAEVLERVLALHSPGEEGEEEHVRNLAWAIQVWKAVLHSGMVR